MSRSHRLRGTAASPWPAALVVAVLSVLAAGVLAQSADPDTDEAALEQDFGAGDFSAPAAEEEEAPQRIDLGNSGSSAVITPSQAAEAASPRTVTEGGEGEGEADDAADDGVFVPSEEIRVDTAIAFPVDI